MTYIDQEQRPRVFSTGNIAGALVLHVLLFLGLWYAGTFNSRPDETVIPIELMVVVNENLDGDPDEPPPEKPVEPAPPEPEPPAPAPEPPPVPEPPVVVPDAIVQEPEKEKPKKPDPPKEIKKPDPPKEVKKPDPPKKTREERLAEIRASTTKISQRKPVAPPKNNGRTEARQPNWEELLRAGYKPGPQNLGLDASEEQRCISLIRQTFHDKWSSPPWTDTLREMLLQVQFGPGGEVRGYRLTQSSGDRNADGTVLHAASLVKAVRGLSPSFLEKNRTVTVRFKVSPE